MLSKQESMQMTAPRFLDLPHARLEYVWLGQQNTAAPTIVMLHEGLGCIELWRDFPQRLADTTGLGVVVYSRQGYGRSSPVALPRPPDYMENDGCRELRAVIDALELDKVLLLGHSDGASIALSYAGTARDSRVLAAIVLAPHVFAEACCREAIHATTLRFQQGDLRERLARYHHDVDGAFHGWSDTWLSPAFVDWDITPLLAGIDVPLLLLQGSDDEYASARHVRLIAHRAQGVCELQLLKCCGHFPHVERTERTLATIATFITRHAL